MSRAKALRPRKQGKQPRAAATRQRILDAAARVFADRGYAGGTTNHIAAEAGLSIGSLYQYFPNKDSILAELVKDHVNQGVAVIQGHLSSGLPEDLDSLLRLFVRAAIENHLDEPRLHQVLFEEAPRPPELLALFRQSEAWVVAAAEEVLRNRADIRVADVGVAARLVVTAIESLVHRHFSGGPPVDVAVFEDELVAMLRRYLEGG